MKILSGRSSNIKLVPVTSLFIAFFVCCSSLGWAASQDSYPAPSQLPNVKTQMLTAGYWIARHPSADQVIMGETQINAFNDHIRNGLKLTKDIFSLVDQFQTESLMDVFKKNLEDFTNKGFYTVDGLQNDSVFIEKAKTTMHLSGLVLGVAPRYGLSVHLANLRLLPTSVGLYAKKGDVDFDELQNSGLDLGSAVAVIHQSQDKKWFYVLSALSDGWVKAEDVAIGDSKQVKGFAEAKDFVVITSPKADIYLNEAMDDFYDYVRMGMKLPVLAENDQQWIVQIPMKDKQGQLQLDKGYIAKFQAHRGYLPYTARTIYTQAFLMLDKPYGWGDMYGAQDCSRFLQMIYASVGIELPRDSKNQAQVGEQLVSFDEKATNDSRLEELKNIPGASSILPLKGHIMLYLGMVDSIPYAMHDSSGYSQTKDNLQIKYTLNRVVVSDLSLGEGSAKGSLLRRLIKIVGVQ